MKIAAQTTAQYTIEGFDLVKLGNGNECNINCSVTGFWSHKVMSIYVSNILGLESKFKVKISVSSGGRDISAVESDAEAFANYAAALRALTDTAKLIEAKVSVMESAADAKYAKYRAEAEAERNAVEA